MADDMLRVTIGLQVLHFQFLGYSEAGNQGLIFGFVVCRGKPKSKSVLNDVSLKAGEN